MIVFENHVCSLLESVADLNMDSSADIDIVCSDGTFRTHSLLLGDYI